MGTIDTVTSYTDLLYNLQNYTDEKGGKYPQITDLPNPQDGVYFNVDLNTREIESPQFLSTQYDHNAEVVYFKCARYLDNVDLATMTIVIQYVNANGDAGIQWVPYVEKSYEYPVEDDTSIVTPLIIIPWTIEGLATAYPGIVTFNLKFYNLSSDKSTYLYNMNTKPATGEVLHGMDLSDESLKIYNLDNDTYNWEVLLQGIKQAQSNATTYWLDV